MVKQHSEPQRLDVDGWHPNRTIPHIQSLAGARVQSVSRRFCLGRRYRAQLIYSMGCTGPPLLIEGRESPGQDHSGGDCKHIDRLPYDSLSTEKVKEHNSRRNAKTCYHTAAVGVESPSGLDRWETAGDSPNQSGYEEREASKGKNHTTPM